MLKELKKENCEIQGISSRTWTLRETRDTSAVEIGQKIESEVARWEEVVGE